MRQPAQNEHSAHEKRHAVLRAFHDQSRNLSEPEEILTALAGLLSDRLDVEHLIYGEAPDGDLNILDVFHALRGVPQRETAARFRFSQAFHSFVRHYTWHQSRVINDNTRIDRPADDPVRQAAELLGVRSGINVPIVKDGRPVAMLVVLDSRARDWVRDEIELCEELAERVWVTVSRARAEAALQERERNQAFLIEWSDRIRGETSPEAILETTLAALGQHLDVSRATFSEADDTGRLFTIVGEWRDRVMSIAGTSFSLDDVGATVEGEWVSGAVVRYDDIAADPRIEQQVVDGYEGAQILAFVSVPLIENAMVRSALSVQQNAPRRWRDSEIQLLRDIAERTWVTLERARAEAELQERERHQAFLIGWSDAVRGLSAPAAIMDTTLEWIGRHLRASRTTHSECDASGRLFTITGEWNDGVTPVRGNQFYLENIGMSVDREWSAGEIVRYDNVLTDPRLEPPARERYQGNDILAFVSIPLVQGAQMFSALSVQQNMPRKWRDSEIQLLRDIAERTWVAIERARVQTELEERERNQAFLLRWSDRIRCESSARGILGATLATLGEHLGALRANFAEPTADGEALCVLQEWSQGAVNIVNQRYPLDALGSRLRASHLSGEPVRVDDTHDDYRFDEHNIPLFDSLGIHAVLTLPMMRGSEVAAVLSVQNATPRRWTDAEVRLVRDLADRTLAVLERAHSEERLAESEAQLSAFLENAPVAMHLKDGDGRYVRVNPELARAIGRGMEEITGAHPDELFEPEVAARIEALEILAQEGKVSRAEIDMGDAEQYSSILGISFPVGTAGVARTAGFTIDLTERKKTEEALARSREALYQTEKLSALGSLLAGVSHELNNPLSIVVAQAVMMERQSRGGELAERAQKIRKAADRCARIVQTFLAMARQKRPERESVDLNAVAMAAYDLAEYGMRTGGIAARRDLAESLPSISADADQLHQIIINLLINAQQALTDSGAPEPRVTLRTAPGREPGTVVLEVADNGPGIPDDSRRRIFEPFFTTKPQGQGTGVGLSFSQGLAEAHGGRLELVPSTNGACFRLTLPIDAERRLAPVAAEPAPAEPVPARRALVVDDEAEIAESLADFLSIEGFACEIAIGGAAAKTRLASASYDLIVSDLRMPGIDGPQLHAWIQAERPELADRVGFATGDTLGLQAARFLDEVKRPVLEKPFMPDAVQRFLKQMDLA